MAASRSMLQPLLRHAAPHLTKRWFACRPCPASRQIGSSQPASTATPHDGARAFRTTKTTPFLAAFRSQSTVAPAPQNRLADLAKKTEMPALAGKTAGAKNNEFPKTSDRVVALWLMGSAVSVFGLVVFGGLTRLTESGLSITEWRPVTGSLPPFTAATWSLEFGKYKASPEFQKLNPNMTIEEFKRIYWMEWTHRLWGRVVGLTILAPTVYFIARKRVSVPMARNLILINGLIITQGCVGWWMVASGLKNDLFASGAVPRVSQYRLATHLMLAFATYTAMVWNALQIFRERTFILREQPNRSLKLIERLASPRLRTFRVATMATSVLAVVTAFSGALVAGLDAGLIYNQFPYMGEGLTPPRSELFSAFYSRKEDQSDLVWRNLFENPSLVQLDHRILAVTTFTAVNALFFYGRRSMAVRHGLTGGARRTLAACFGLVWLQASLGLTTLLYLVPLPIAAAHQAGALALLTGFTVLASRVLTPPRLVRLVRERIAATTRQKVRKGERAFDGKVAGPTRQAMRKLEAE